MTNYKQELPELINKSDRPVVCIFIQGQCTDPDFNHPAQGHLEYHIDKTDKPYIVYTVCHHEENMPFPEPKADWVYFFAPKVLRPITSSPITNLKLEILNRYINAVYKMMDDYDLTFNDAYMTDDERQVLRENSELLNEEDQSETKYPPYMEMVRNLAKDTVKSAVRLKKKLPVIVPKNIAMERLEMCMSCPHYTDEHRCTKCGCFMKSKVNVAAAECPVGKWKKYD